MKLLFCEEILDGAEVSDTARQFLRNWQASKEAVKQKREIGSHTSDKQRMSLYSLSPHRIILLKYAAMVTLCF
jgi:hypothetical protein